MTKTVERIAGEVKALPVDELDELMDWLADFELERLNAWDREIVSDSRPDGRLKGLLDRAREDIKTGRTKPLDEVLDHN
jgi:hypothetical protein